MEILNDPCHSASNNDIGVSTTAIAHCNMPRWRSFLLYALFQKKRNFDRVSSVMAKSWNSWKWQNHFPDLEKSWNLKKRPNSWKNHGISKCIMEKSWNFVFQDFLVSYLVIGHFHSIQIIENAAWIMENSWKNHGIPFWEMAGNPV